MASLSDPPVRALLDAPNVAVVSTLGEDGSMHSAVIWFSYENDELAINSAEGRRWPANIDRDPHVTFVVYSPANPYEYVEVRGTATGTSADADDHIDRLAQRYIGQDEYPRAPGEVRKKYVITPQRVRYVKQA